jgi:hypothetical protein
MVEDGAEVEKRQKQVTFDINQELRTQLDKLGELGDMQKYFAKFLCSGDQTTANKFSFMYS